MWAEWMPKLKNAEGTWVSVQSLVGASLCERYRQKVINTPSTATYFILWPSADISTQKVLGGRIIANITFLQLEKTYEQTTMVLRLQLSFLLVLFRVFKYTW